MKMTSLPAHHAHPTPAEHSARTDCPADGSPSGGRSPRAPGAQGTARNGAHRRRLASAALAAIAGCIGLSVARAQTDRAEEQWNAHLQTTWIRQVKPAFDAAYSGRNSLRAARESSYTFTTTVHLGYRVWSGGEVYLNPELTQGVPLSALTGLGGFSNGEATRVSGNEPSIYRQRLFLRQTWNQGGGSEAVESEANQLAGRVDRDRVVLTAGNFSLLDVFDDNAYAHDPRRQFMNWSLMTHGAYDYAADARGFGWGFALEWYRGDWALRLGRMTPPTEPNGPSVDRAFFRHYGDQVELEHRHSLAGRPGAVRVLAYRNRAVVGRYRDALDAAAASGAVPDIFAARAGEQVKYGFGVNLEQEFTPGAGVFLRAMSSDGRTETLAFTEIDRSLAAGISVSGSAWGRAQDTFGLAFARNMLSADRRDYLAAGGMSFFIGDGALRYRPESVVEAYYSLGIAKGLWVTIDLQRIANPAYNADRGPVGVASLRLHAEY